MKNLFVIDVAYCADIEVIESIRPKHREFLRLGYEAGFLLASGPKASKKGGIIIGWFENLQAAQDFTLKDPFYKHNIAKYEIIEFSPVLHNECIDAFLRSENE